MSHGALELAKEFLEHVGFFHILNSFGDIEFVLSLAGGAGCPPSKHRLVPVFTLGGGLRHFLCNMCAKSP